MNSYARTGLTLTALREQKGLTQKAVSLETGIHASTIHRMEHGQSITTENLTALATFYETTVDKLLHDHITTLPYNISQDIAGVFDAVGVNDLIPEEQRQELIEAITRHILVTYLPITK